MNKNNQVIEGIFSQWKKKKKKKLSFTWLFFNYIFFILFRLIFQVLGKKIEGHFKNK